MCPRKSNEPHAGTSSESAAEWQISGKDTAELSSVIVGAYYVIGGLSSS
jgi:hypothetical protein